MDKWFIMCFTCRRVPALFSRIERSPIAVIRAEVVAEAYATPSCVVLRGDFAFLLV
jgi:hypothetical protein